MNLGWLAGLCLGIVTPVQHYRWVNNVCSIYNIYTIISTLSTPSTVLALPSLVFLALSPWLPESPLWLVRAGRLDQAQHTLGHCQDCNWASRNIRHGIFGTVNGWMEMERVASSPQS